MKPDLEASASSSQDPLDGYRLDVEHHLGERLVLLEEGAFESFFEHVIEGFSRGLPAPECARAWLASRSAPSVRR
jgi:hypothetical protein